MLKIDPARTSTLSDMDQNVILVNLSVAETEILLNCFEDGRSFAAFSDAIIILHENERWEWSR